MDPAPILNRIPPSYADKSRMARFASETGPEARVRIEAAAFQGKPVSFEFIIPKTESAPTNQARMRELAYTLGVSLLFVTALLGGVFFARKNMRLGRGDRRNANRLALFVLCSSMVSWILGASHVSFVDLFLIPYVAAAIWIFYMAIEPFVRRRWPHILVSSTRLLSGEWKDSLVGREALIGSAFGVLVSCILMLSQLQIPSWFGYAELAPPPAGSALLGNIIGARFLISGLLGSVIQAIAISLAVLCLLFIMRVLLKNQKAAIIVCVLIFALIQAPGNLWSFVIMVVFSPIFFFVLNRFGLLATAHVLFATSIIGRGQFPTTLDASAWYAGYGFAALAIFAAIVLYAFRTSLGGQPMLGRASLED